MSVAAVFNDSEMLARIAAIGGAKLTGVNCQRQGIGIQRFSSFAAGAVMINTCLTTTDVTIGKDKRLTNLPSLRHVELHVASACGAGTSHVKNFLERHPLIKSISILLSAQQYEDIVPHIRVPLVDLTTFPNLTANLIDLLHPSVTSIVIGVETTERQSHVLQEVLNPFFDRLQARQCSIKSIRVQTTHAPFPPWQFLWDNPRHPVLTGILARRAFDLRDRGVSILDEMGRSLM
jgi:hypothetical protein